MPARRAEHGRRKLRCASLVSRCIAKAAQLLTNGGRRQAFVCANQGMFMKSRIVDVDVHIASVEGVEGRDLL